MRQRTVKHRLFLLSGWALLASSAPAASASGAVLQEDSLPTVATPRVRPPKRTARLFSFVNIAASGRGTVVRIEASTAAVVGEFLTAPAGRPRNPNPSRTTVDLEGNVWVANRDEADSSRGQPRGSVTRIGVVLGGIRVDGDRTPSDSGPYLKPPFRYNTCMDRDRDGLIRTSRGLGDVLPWSNEDEADTHGGVSTAEDECIINFTRVVGIGARTLAVTRDNDLWVGGYLNRDHEKINGTTGAPMPGTQFNLGCGGYGGLIDGNGVLWSAGRDSLLRFDTKTMTGRCLDVLHGDYGLAIDPRSGEIWHTIVRGAPGVVRLKPDGSIVDRYSHGASSAQGVVVDNLGNVWVAHSLARGVNTVGHLTTQGEFVGNVTLPGGDGPTGVAVDPNGKVWVANFNSNNVMRIDPNAGPIGGAGIPIGAVDTVVELGAGATPYNYSDMTGFVAPGSPRTRDWMEALMETTTLVVTFGLLAFLVERLTNGVAIVLGYSGWWRARMEVPATADPDTRVPIERNRRVALFSLSVVLAVVGALVLDLNILSQLGLTSADSTAGTVATGLLIAAGADPIREFIRQRSPEERSRRESPPAQVQVTGTLIVRDASQSPAGNREPH